MRAAFLALALTLGNAGLAPAAEPAPAGWTPLTLPQSGSYAQLYVPPALDRAVPAPLVLFLHGAGSSPQQWKSMLGDPADQAGVVIVAPRSKGLGWEVAEDQQVMAEALAAARERVLVDPRRIAVAGHSAGGAAAVRTAYGMLDGRLPRWSGVFILSSPFAAVGAVEDPAYTAPLRQYYGMSDPNYLSGSRDAMRAQWLRLGVPFEEEIEPGFGHATWPAATLPEGFAFLARQVYPGYSATCEPTATSVCLDRGRFRVSVAWRTASASGAGRSVPIASGDSGLFWFFSPGNVELLLKVLDGCSANGRVWVFASATTSVEYTLTATDTVRDVTRVYRNPLGHAATPVTDTSAFASCD